MSAGPSTDEFECEVCRDAGFVHPLVEGKPDYTSVVTCACSKEKLAAERNERYLKYCQLPVGSEEKTFENFDAGNNVSLREAKKVALQMAEGQGNIKWLSLIGEVDRGKTHLEIAICRRWLERRKPARYAFVPLLLIELRDGFDLEGELSYRQRLNFLLNVPLLVLDDLGVERPTPWGIEQLQTIIHYRGLNGLPLVVTTNRPLNDLIAGSDRDENINMASQRIASRLQREAWCKVIVIKAQEYRIQRGSHVTD